MHADTPQSQAALSFLTLVTTGNTREAYDAHIHPEFRHHNQYHTGDRAALLKGMEDNDAQFPDKKFEVKRLLEDGDMVVAHSLLEFGGGMRPMTVAHFLRFQDGKIIEMWDIGQEIPKDSPNENGPF
jgi:predicted SnoaL-like aldol condensation-catalyzing enzyme